MGQFFISAYNRGVSLVPLDLGAYPGAEHHDSFRKVLIDWRCIFELSLRPGEDLRGTSSLPSVRVNGYCPDIKPNFPGHKPMP